MEAPEHHDEAVRRIDEKVEGIIKILRNDLLSLEDLELLEEDFFEGIQIILLRRYMAAGRVLDFEPPPGPGKSPKPGAHLSVLYAVFQEVATNDIKYGVGMATWKFHWSRPGELELHFASRSHYHLSTHGTGHGTAGMLRRLSEIGGTLRISMDTSDENGDEHNRPIQIKIIAPISKQSEVTDSF